MIIKKIPTEKEIARELLLTSGHVKPHQVDEILQDIIYNKRFSDEYSDNREERTLLQTTREYIEIWDESTTLGQYMVPDRELD